LKKRNWLRLAMAVLLVASHSTRAAGQGSADTIRIASAGPRGSGADILRGVIAGEPLVMRSDTGVVTVPRTARYERSLLVFAEGVRFAGTVEGDLVVVGGDLFVHPGAVIRGRAISLGGGVYPSSLASIGGERRAYRDGVFVWSDVAGGLQLDYRPLVGTYRPPLFTLPVLYGARFPTYDRVDGLSLRWGPFLQPSRNLSIDPTVTYRSHRGAFDPAVTVELVARDVWRVELEAARETRTNDAWIRGDIINSIATLLSGRDARNYYRATGFGGRIYREIEHASGSVELFAGASHERASSALSPPAVNPAPGFPLTPGGAPWSLRGKKSADGMLRPNPFVPDGRISSSLAGFSATLERRGLKSKVDFAAEVPWQVSTGSRFAQLTMDGTISFPTFGSHTFRFDWHWLTTPRDTAPPQRWSYLGGSGTLPTFDLLQFGGDELLFLEGRYTIPLGFFTLPLAGSPSLSLRHMLGSAGVGSLPDLEQNLALRLQLAILRIEYVINPRNSDRKLEAGFTLSR
jgi:hypothetical protein